MCKEIRHFAHRVYLWVLYDHFLNSIKQLLLCAMKMKSNGFEVTKQLNINVALNATCTQPSREDGV
jgi:hypothetical protein